MQREKKKVLMQLQSYIQRYEEGMEGEREEEYQIIDVKDTKSYRKNWNHVINVGTVEYLLQAQVQKFVLQLHEELGFIYVRLWNLFSDDIVSSQELNGYNFDKLDRVLEFLLKNGIRPFLVFGAKPKIVMKTIANNLIDQKTGEAEFFENPKKWEQFFRLWMEHITEQYEKEEVSRWVFEFWKPNEWDNVYEPDYLTKWYLEWFQISCQLIKKYFPQALTGGCEFPAKWNDNWIKEAEQLFQCFQKINYKPDFLSIAAYPYHDGAPSAEWEYLGNAITRARKVFDEIGYADVSLMVTEWIKPER